MKQFCLLNIVLFVCFCVLKTEAQISIIQNGKEQAVDGRIEWHDVDFEDDSVLGTSMAFDGESSFGEVANFKVDSIFTLSLWFNSRSLLRRNTTLAGVTDCFLLRTTTRREIQFTQPRRVDRNTEGIFLGENCWYYVTLRVFNRKADVYLNGELKASFLWKGDFTDKTQIFYIGRSHWQEHFRGSIAQFEYINRPLSDDEIKDSYYKAIHGRQLTDGLVYCNGFEQRGVDNSVDIAYDVQNDANRVARFNGESSYIQVNDSLIDNQVSFSAFIKCNSELEQHGAIFDAEQAYAFRTRSKQLLFTIPQLFDYDIVEKPIELDRWYHVGFTFHESKCLSVYVDGELVTRVDVPFFMDAEKHFRIGNNIWNNFFFGQMDNIAIWNRIISDDEMRIASTMSSRFWDMNSKSTSSNSRYLLIGVVCILLMLLTLYFLFFKLKKRGVNKANYRSSQDFVDPNIERAYDVVKTHFSDSSFGVDKFALEMLMSKTKLYNLLRDNCKMSTKEFIRNYRLKHAADLLRSTDMSVTEIVFETGFESRAYFNKCFREMYDSTPTEFRNSARLV